VPPEPELRLTRQEENLARPKDSRSKWDEQSSVRAMTDIVIPEKLSTHRVIIE